MHNIDLINDLMVELKDAAVSNQWSRLQEVDGRIAKELELLSQHQPVSKEMAGVLTKLQYIYMKIFTACQQQHDLLAQKMAELRNNRDGMTAYAEMDNFE